MNANCYMSFTILGIDTTVDSLIDNLDGEEYTRKHNIGGNPNQRTV